MVRSAPPHCWPGLLQRVRVSGLLSLPSVSLVNRKDSRCLLLDVQRCPEANTMYTCVLESPGLAPLRRSVAVTIIQGTWRWGSPNCLRAACLQTSSLLLGAALPSGPGSKAQVRAQEKAQAGLRLLSPPPAYLSSDGDIVCPDDFSEAAWKVTKAGHVAQVPCPMDKTGMVARPCGPDGVWGPVWNSCTDTRILALYEEARVKQLPSQT